MYKVAAIGNRESVFAFKAIGIETFPVKSGFEARKIIDNLAGKNYGLIFLTEQVASEIQETVDRYKKKILPAIILVPGTQGSLGIGLSEINRNVEKAVGSNILADSDDTIEDLEKEEDA